MKVLSSKVDGIESNNIDSIDSVITEINKEYKNNAYRQVDLICDEFTKQDFKRLLLALYKSARPILLKLSPTNQTEKKSDLDLNAITKTFDDLFQARKKICELNEANKGHQTITHNAGDNRPNQTRSAKVLMDKLADHQKDMYFEPPHQHILEQKRKIRANVNANSEQSIVKDKENVKVEATTDQKVNVITNFDHLINANNIEKQSSYFATFIKEASVKNKQLANAVARAEVSLQQIWDNLVGVNANQLNNKMQDIVHIEDKAMEKVIEHYQDFQFGVTIERLPKGFYIKQIKKNDNPNLENCLCFDEEISKKQEMDNDPFRLVLTKQENLPPYEYKQFVYHNPSLFGNDAFNGFAEKLYDAIAKNNFSVEDQNVLQTKLANLADESDNKRDAIAYFGFDSTDVNHLNELGLNCNPNLLPQFAAIIIEYGHEHFVRILEKLSSLKLNHAAYFEDFKLLLAKIDLRQLASQTGLKQLQSLISINETNLMYWSKLSTQHINAGATVDFNRMYDAYQFFIDTINTISDQETGEEYNLPPTYPFAEIKNIYTALDRLLFIIGNDSDANRLKRLNQLFDAGAPDDTKIDLSSEGAYLARKHGNYNIVDRNMRVSPNDNLNLKLTGFSDAYQAKSAVTIVNQILHNNELNLAQTNLDYYRYIGQKHAHISYSELKDLAEHINQLALPNQFASQNKINTQEEINLQGMIKLNKAIDKNTKIKEYLLCLVLIIQAEPTAFGKTLNDNENLASLLQFMGNKLTGNDANDAKLLSSFCKSILSSYASSSVNNQIMGLTYADLKQLYIACDGKEDCIKLLPEIYNTFTDNTRKFIEIVNARNELARGDANAIINSIDLFELFNYLKEIKFPVNSIIKTEQNQVLIQLLGMWLALTSDEKHLNAKQSKEFFAILNCKDMSDFYVNKACLLKFITLNLKKSKQHLEPNDILPFISDIKKALPDIEYTALLDDKNPAFKESLNDLDDMIIRASGADTFRNVIFGDGTIEPTTFDIQNAFQEYIAKHGPDFKNIFAGLPASATSSIQPIFEKLIYTAKTGTITELLQVAQSLDTKIDGIMNSLLVKAYLKTNIGKEDIKDKIKPFAEGANIVELCDCFIKERSVLVFIKIYIKDIFNKKINSIFTPLDNITLKNLCSGYLGDIADDKTMEGLCAYNNKFKTIVNLGNQLIGIRNQDEGEYVNSNSELNQLLRSYEKIPFNLLHELIAVLATLSPPTEISKQLKCLNERIRYSSDASMDSLIEDFILDIRPYVIKHELVSDLQKSMLANMSWPEKDILQYFMRVDQILSDYDKDKNIAAAKSFFDVNKHAIENTIVNPEFFEVANALLKSCTKQNLIETNFIRPISSIINNANNIKYLSIIINALFKNTQSENSINYSYLTNLILKLTTLPRAEVTLQKIADIYSILPYPKFNDKYGRERNSLDTLIDILNIDKDTEFKQTIEALERNPFNLSQDVENNIREKGLDTVATAINEIQDYIHGNYLSQSKEQTKQLANDIATIDSIGKSKLKVLTRKELQALFIELKHDIQNHKTNNNDVVNNNVVVNNKARLAMIAVLREVMFRTTGKYPYLNQIIAVDHALNQDRNTLMQIGTGAGKTMVAGLLAAMQCVQGETVDVCTANTDLAKRDFEELKHFFDFLNIGHAFIDTNSNESAYKTGGINYSTISDLALYKLRASIESSDSVISENKAHKNSLILDEVDFSTLDDNTVHAYTLSSDDMCNRYDWFYYKINAFIDSESFKESKDPVEQFNLLGTYLQNELAAEKNKQQLSHEEIQRNELLLKDSYRLNNWLDNACEAKSNWLSQKYIVVKERDGSLFARPLMQNVPQLNDTFLDNQQQFLHARLNSEWDKHHYNDSDSVGNHKSPFLISPELVVIANTTSKAFIEQYNDSGKIFGFSGTIGTIAEAMELKYSLNNAYIYKMPASISGNRVAMTKACNNSKQMINVIKNQISHVNTLPHVVLEIKTDLTDTRTIEADMHDITYQEWSYVKKILKDIAAIDDNHNNENHKDQVEADCRTYLENLNITQTQALEKVNKTIFHKYPQISIIINKIMNHTPLKEEEEFKLLRTITRHAKYKLKWLDTELPQPSLVICKNPETSKQMFKDLTGISFDEWEQGRLVLRQISKSFDSNRLNRDIEHTDYLSNSDAVATQQKTILKRLKNTIFKDAPDIEMIIDKIDNNRKLNAFDLRTLSAISTNTYYQQMRRDFLNFVSSISDNNEIDSNNEERSGERDKQYKYLINGLFKHHPKIIDAINMLNGNKSEGNGKNNSKEMAKLFLQTIANKPWYTFIDNKYLEYELIVGEESEAERVNKIQKAGNPYTVTVSTSLIGRGVDIKPQHNKGMQVIQTYIDTKRNTEQIMGRCARNDDKGTYALIFDKDDVVNCYETNISQDSESNLNAIEKMQQTLYQHNAFNRYTNQRINAINQALDKELQQYEKFINILYSADDKDIRYHNRMVRLNLKRVNLLKTMKLKQNELLSDCMMDKDTDTFDKQILVYKDVLFKCIETTEQEIEDSFINPRITLSNEENNTLAELTNSKIDVPTNLIQPVCDNNVTDANNNENEKSATWQTRLGINDNESPKATIFDSSELNIITNYLKSNLKWVEHPYSLSYIFERKKIRDTAKDILQKIKQIEQKKPGNAEQVKLYNELYQQLCSKNDTINQLWSIGKYNILGHADTKQVLDYSISKFNRLNIIAAQRKQSTYDDLASNVFEELKKEILSVLDKKVVMTEINLKTLSSIGTVIKNILLDETKYHECVVKDVLFTIDYYLKAIKNPQAKQVVNILNKLKKSILKNKYNSINRTNDATYTDDIFISYKQAQLNRERNLAKKNGSIVGFNILQRAGNISYEVLINSEANEINGLNKVKNNTDNKDRQIEKKQHLSELINQSLNKYKLLIAKEKADKMPSKPDKKDDAINTNDKPPMPMKEDSLPSKVGIVEKMRKGFFAKLIPIFRGDKKTEDTKEIDSEKLPAQLPTVETAMSEQEPTSTVETIKSEQPTLAVESTTSNERIYLALLSMKQKYEDNLKNDVPTNKRATGNLFKEQYKSINQLLNEEINLRNAINTIDINAINQRDPRYHKDRLKNIGTEISLFFHRVENKIVECAHGFKANVAKIVIKSH